MAARGLAVVLIAIVVFKNIDTNPHENALNLPQVLLPYVTKGTKPTTFVLKAQKGCFKWSSSKPGVATITPIKDAVNNTSQLIEDDDEQCSQSALVTVKHKSQEEDSTVVLAEEDGTGFILRCDVFVDSIHHIEIETTTRELLLGENPDVFDVHGYDQEGNLFTTLGSESFEWKFLPAPHNEHIDPRNILHFIWFSDSTYDTNPEIYELEEKRVRGYSVLVEGFNTGEALVWTKLSHPEYKVVKPSQVKVIVIDNIMLIPPVVYIMVNQNITYSAQQLRRGKIREITLPSNQYSVSVIDKEIGNLQAKSAIVDGKRQGATKVQLIDNNMGEQSTVKKPTANLFVVEPAKIGFSIKPGKSWVLQTGNIYEINVHIYDEDNNAILINADTILKSNLPEEYFEIFYHSANGSYFHVKAKKKGKTLLTSTLSELRNVGGKVFKLKPIFGEQPIEIFDELQVHPKIVLFPWDPTLNSNTLHKYQLKITGGSGAYVWQSMNASFPISMTKKNIITVENQIGSGVIKIIDAKNNLHTTECKVIVLPPDEMSFNVSVVEVLVGKAHLLPLTVSAYLDEGKKNLIQFTQCSKMVIDIHFSEGNIFQVTKDQTGLETEHGCTSVSVTSLKPGFTTVHATYRYVDVILKASVVIAAYNPVEIIDPVKIAVVTLGSKKIVVAKDGPLPWILDDRKYYELISAEEEEWVQIEKVNKPDETANSNYHYFLVTCHHFGEQMLTINVGNHKTAKNLFPASSTARTRFSCSPPASMKIFPVINLPTINGVARSIDTCRDDQKRTFVRNDRQLRLNLEVYDNKGMLFDDVSSLLIEWNIDNNKIASITNRHETMFEEVQCNEKNKQNSRNQGYQYVNLARKEMPLNVIATIQKYKVPVEELDFSPISANAHLLLISEPQIEPYHSNIFAHATNKARLQINGGTKHFVVGGNDYGFIKYLPPNVLSVTPKGEGKLIVTLYDACLDLVEPAKAIVEMSDVYPLRLLVQDKVETGSNITAVCQALNQKGEVIRVSDVTSQMKLRLKSSVDILGIQRTRNEESGESQVSYLLTGKTPGFTSLSCLATSLAGNEISSKAEEVQVFSAMELEPKYILLIVGSTFKVHSIGGPKPHSVTVFSLDNETVADVDYEGIVTAKNIGKTILTGKSKGVDSNTGKEIVFSKDTVIVEVIQLKGFKILTKSRQVISNSEIGITVVGITDEGPFTFASSPPYLQFDWSTTNHDIATVESLNYKNGVSIATDRDFRAVLKAQKNSGVVSVKLKVKVLSRDFSQVSRYAQLEDAVVIQVYEKLRLVYPENGELLLSHDSYAKIIHNRDQSSHVTYELQETTCSGRGNPLIKVTSSGDITSFSTSGVVSVRVVVHEDFGFNQSVVFQVEVRSVASISLVSLSFPVVKSSSRPAFPIGSIAVFGVTSHDNMGRKFDVLNMALKIRMSRSDVVHATQNTENGTIMMRAAAVGETIVKIWDKDHPSINDYIRVKVTHGIQPTKLSLRVGEIACFDADTTTDGTSDGEWSSSGKLLSVEKNLGVVIGIASGKTMLLFNKGDFNSYSEVTVTTPIENPSLVDDEGFLFLTNSVKEKYVFIRSNDDHGKSCPHLPNNFTSPFTCSASWGGIGSEVPFDDVFLVRSVTEKIRPACRFETKKLSQQLSKTLSAQDRNILFTVAVRDETTKVEYKSSLYTLRFIPKLYLDSERLKFTSKDTASQVIDVYGSQSQLSSLKINYDNEKIKVTKQELSDNTRQRYLVTVNVYPVANDFTKLTFHSQLTNEDHVIDIEISGDPKSIACPTLSTENSLMNSVSYFMGGASFWIVFYTLIFATIVACLVLYHVLTRNRQTQPLVFSSPYMVAPASPPPYHYSPGAFNTSPHQHYSNTPTSIERSGSTRPKQRTLYSVSQ